MIVNIRATEFASETTKKHNNHPQHDILTKPTGHRTNQYQSNSQSHLSMLLMLLLYLCFDTMFVFCGATTLNNIIASTTNEGNKSLTLAEIDLSQNCIIKTREDEQIDIKVIGTVWQDETNPCLKYSCEPNVHNQTAVVVRIEEDCGSIYCGAESELRSKLGTCCGECVQTKCKFNNHIFEIGQTWHDDDNCALLECSQLPGGQPIINTYQKTCPPLDCSPEETFTENCCQYCRVKEQQKMPNGSDEQNDIWTEEFYRNHPCARKCQLNQPSLICNYTFVIETFETLSKACYFCPQNLTDCTRPHCIVGDGIARTVTVVNRMMPGPSIEVCLGDTINIDVRNELLGDSTTMHWHGLHQTLNPYMDGVPHITQCPISPHSTFRYTFKADIAGTHFYHSHTGMQRGDGDFGALIIRRPKSTDPHQRLYDFDLSEHKIIVQDWVHVPGNVMFSSHHFSSGDNKPRNILVNGRGRYFNGLWNKIKKEAKSQESDQVTSENIPETGILSDFEYTLHQHENNTMSRLTNSTQDKTREEQIGNLGSMNSNEQRPRRSTDAGAIVVGEGVAIEAVPLHKYKVKHGFRYRFRLINAEFLNCPILISVDNHTLTAINSDGYDFEATDVGSIVTYSGERFDFIVHANQPVSNYWMRFKGLMDCSEKFTSAFQVAILQYENAEDSEPEGKIEYNHTTDGIELNAMNRGSGYVDSLTIAELTALPYYDSTPGIDRDVLKSVADYKFFIYYDFYRKDNPVFHPSDYYGINAELSGNGTNQLFSPQLNHISLKFPTVALLPSRFEIEDSIFCNETSLQQHGIDCRKEFCKCHHVLQVPLNTIVELIIVDEGFTFDANHPFHLHGNAFRVVGLERLGENVTIETVKELDKLNLLKRNLIQPPVKDTVTVPDGGYTIVRFKAYNPGFWLFHCHIEFHAEIGMALVFKVGSNDEMLPVPKNFPTCNNYVPDNVDPIPDPGKSGANALRNNTIFEHFLIWCFGIYLLGRFR